MITASITLSTMTGKAAFSVEIINVLTTSDGRKIAEVEALPINGETVRPFTEYTHGGPCQVSTAFVPVDRLENIAISVDMPVFTPAEVGSR